MTAIHQNSISNHHSIDDASHQSANGNGAGNGRDKQSQDNNAQNVNASTVNISFHAELQLRAYQEQRKAVMDTVQPGSAIVSSENVNNSLNALPERQVDISNNEENAQSFPKNITTMLSEIQNNIVQKSHPGYQYLVNVLNNNRMIAEDPQQLQEVMRKEQFFLSRRKPFMQNADYQSYSQVLSQFSNIVERQQYDHQSIL